MPGGRPPCARVRRTVPIGPWDVPTDWTTEVPMDWVTLRDPRLDVLRQHSFPVLTVTADGTTQDIECVTLSTAEHVLLANAAGPTERSAE